MTTCERNRTDDFMFRSFEIHSRIFRSKKLDDYFMISSGTNQFPMPHIWKECFCMETESDYLYRWYTSSSGFQSITSAVKVYEDYISGSSKEIFSQSNRSVCMTIGGCGAASSVFDYLKYKYTHCCVILAGMNYSLYDRLSDKNSFRLIELRRSEDNDALPLSEDFRNMEKNYTEKEIYVFSVPNNPTGEFYSYDEFSDIFTSIKERGGFIILDTVCSLPVTQFPMPSYESVITANDYWHSCAVVNSFSKTDSVAGLRLGYIYSSERITSFCSRLNASDIMNPPTFPAFSVVLACLFRCMYISEASGHTLMRHKFIELFRKLFFLTSAGLPVKMRNYAEHIFSSAEKYCIEYTDEILSNEQIIRKNYNDSVKILTPYIRKVSKFDAGFNFCIWFNRPFNMGELELIRKLIDATGVAILTESSFSCKNVRDNSYFIRFSSACERNPYMSALERLITFLESEGFEY